MLWIAFVWRIDPCKLDHSKPVSHVIPRTLLVQAHPDCIKVPHVRNQGLHRLARNSVLRVVLAKMHMCHFNAPVANFEFQDSSFEAQSRDNSFRVTTGDGGTAQTALS